MCNVERLHRQPKAHMATAMVTGWKRVIKDACNLMTLGVNRIVDDIIYPRVRNLIAGLEKVANFCHHFPFADSAQLFPSKFS